MVTLGINLEKNSFRYTVLSGTRKSPKLKIKEKVTITAASSISQLMDWYETTFKLIIDKNSPDKIGAKLSLEGKRNQIAYWYYPYGILHMICYKKGLQIEEFTVRNFTPSKFNLPKTTDLYDYIDKNIGEFPPYWDRNQKYSVLSAWMVMK
jgi:hypothetical protein